MDDHHDRADHADHHPAPGHGPGRHPPRQQTPLVPHYHDRPPARGDARSAAEHHRADAPQSASWPPAAASLDALAAAHLHDRGELLPRPLTVLGRHSAFAPPEAHPLLSPHLLPDGPHASQIAGGDHLAYSSSWPLDPITAFQQASSAPNDLAAVPVAAADRATLTPGDAAEELLKTTDPDHRELALRLWEAYMPQPPPSGGDGNSAEARALLEELARHVQQPLARAAIACALQAIDGRS